MRQTQNRCDQILDLIDACLRELAPVAPVPTPAYAMATDVLQPDACVGLRHISAGGS